MVQTTFEISKTKEDKQILNLSLTKVTVQDRQICTVPLTLTTQNTGQQLLP